MDKRQAAAGSPSWLNKSGESSSAMGSEEGNSQHQLATKLQEDPTRPPPVPAARSKLRVCVCRRG